MRTLYVELGERAYPIYIGRGLLEQGLYTRHLDSAQALIVTNTTLSELYLDTVRRNLARVQCDVVQLPDGEAYKNLRELEKIFDALVDGHHDRYSTIIALGGGVVGDMAGFAAACYQRGIQFIQLPTTLLAQVDSSVGGKTAVNHQRAKNMIGAFHQPVAVVIDTDVLESLPVREYRAGLAEVIKYGLIRDAEFFDWLEARAPALSERDPEVLREAIYRSCHNKSEVVAGDERERGDRALLNLGHTFGHAIETATGYNSWLHGEAVAAGMVMAADMSVREGRMGAPARDRIVSLFRQLSLPTAPPALCPEEFRSLMGQDKKVERGQMRLVLMDGIGEACVTADFEPQALDATLDAMRSAS